MTVANVLENIIIYQTMLHGQLFNFKRTTSKIIFFFLILSDYDFDILLYSCYPD